MSSTGGFFGQITIDADNKSMEVDAVAVNLTEGDYYIYNPGNSATSLVDHIASVAQTSSGKTVTASVSATGILTFTASSSITLEFNTYVYSDLGFDNAIQVGTSIVAPEPLRYCWFPGRLPSDTLAPTSRAGQIEDIYSQEQAADEVMYSSKWGTSTVQSLTYEFLSKAKVWNASSDYSSLEEFWGDVLSQGRTFIFYPDWNDSTTTYWVYSADLKATPNFAPKRSNPPVDNWWSYTMTLRKVG